MMHAITRNEAKARGLIIEVTSSVMAYRGPRFNPDEIYELIEDTKGDHDDREVNARLIAAAPELLEACKLLLSIVHLQNGNQNERINKIQDIASAAIAKVAAQLEQIEPCLTPAPLATQTSVVVEGVDDRGRITRMRLTDTDLVTIRAGGIVGIETIAATNPLDIPDPYDQQ